jgi:hypothetical protein
MEKFIKFILTLITFLCLYIILTVGLKLTSPLSDSENVNQVLLNLSYSYIAGLIFYFFVTLFPYLILKYKLKPALDLKLNDLKMQITSYVRSFNSVEIIDLNNLKLADMQKLLDTHGMLDRSHYSLMLGTTISNLDFLNSTKINIFKLVETILSYRDFLTSTQILELEKIRDSNFFHLIKMGNLPNATILYNSKEFKNGFANNFFEIIQSVRKL